MKDKTTIINEAWDMRKEHTEYLCELMLRGRDREGEAESPYLIEYLLRQQVVFEKIIEQLDTLIIGLTDNENDR